MFEKRENPHRSRTHTHTPTCLKEFRKSIKSRSAKTVKWQIFFCFVLCCCSVSFKNWNPISQSRTALNDIRIGLGTPNVNSLRSTLYGSMCIRSTTHCTHNLNTSNAFHLISIHFSLSLFPRALAQYLCTQKFHNSHGKRWRINGIPDSLQFGLKWNVKNLKNLSFAVCEMNAGTRRNKKGNREKKA